MALVRTIRVPVRVPVSDTRMGGSHTRMSEGDGVLNMKSPLVIRVWGRGYAYHTRMRGAIRVWPCGVAVPEWRGVCSETVWHAIRGWAWGIRVWAEVGIPGHVFVQF